ncbi:MAG TPA: DASS family sodium-coupled anion symporter [Vicinamibacterales bacterium]|nr:DASS family sodium-coupled anion symporter [Vicinamibacterales bacterium]
MTRAGFAGRVIVPLLLGGAIALAPVPSGLPPAAWHYLALFVTVITLIITEPIPAAALGLAGVTAAAVLGLVRDTPRAAAEWALSGFGNTIVWLIFAAFMFTVGYAQTGLGRRIALHLVRLLGHRTLGLGYAVTLAELAFAPFTPSATARSAGTIYPVISHIPQLYGSRPHDGSSRLLGAYLLYTALAVSFITSSMFITGLAPNALAITIIEETAKVEISWLQWFIGFAPIGFVLLALTPLVLYVIYPPSIRTAPEVPRWAADQLRQMGPMTRQEVILLVLVGSALALWIAATDYIDPALTAVLIVLLMVVSGVVSWDDVIGQKQAWNVLIWFGTLVTLAAGLSEVGFVGWLAKATAPTFTQLSLGAAIAALVGTFFFLHYFFASITAHTATLLAVFLGVALGIEAISPTRWSLLLAYPLGLMGVLTFYSSGQSVIYYASGYISRRDFWVLGFLIGTMFIGVYLLLITRWLAFLGY